MILATINERIDIIFNLPAKKSLFVYNKKNNYHSLVQRHL